MPPVVAARRRPRTFPQGAHGQSSTARSTGGLWLSRSICARLQPGAAHNKATIKSEMPAAQAGGITTVIPPDTRPVIDTPSVVDASRRARARRRRPTRVRA
jgi:dihydroorotase